MSHWHQTAGKQGGRFHPVLIDARQKVIDCRGRTYYLEVSWKLQTGKFCGLVLLRGAAHGSQKRALELLALE